MNFKSLLAVAAMLTSVGVFAQNTPVGVWQSVDDKTKEAKAEITITEAGGVLTGRNTKLLSKNAAADEVCEKCTDARKGKPILGLDIVRGAKKDDEDNIWVGGKILDPENGKDYTLKLTPKDGGKKLDVRGSIGPFGRTQTWTRVQ